MIIEEYEGQKIDDILKYNIDIFAIGSDWKGKFDYLNKYCKVVYLERTKGISSTQLREKKNGIIKLGIVGYGRIANRFVPESRFVSGINVEGVFGPNQTSLEQFVKKYELAFFTSSYNELLDRVDAVYIASPHLTHYEYIKKALIKDKHVLCEKPIVLSVEQAHELYALAKEKNVFF
ncbi:Gfo/Idh/MocA family oxidoreductase [Defluviitalea phaphyphila]|uniref:Gfo/Idh/MocA family oxidoreductase n=1 Tax=Defluviitalea phaphyphila TaxID=1473580 RepID=UPI002E8E533A|nr:Gfo/Idh/MocA family oxidoreductase [Defluviitalea phaphyphila]